MDSLSLSNPLVASTLVGGSLVAIAYGDAKFNDKDRSNEVYVKLFAVTFAITFAIMYMGGPSNSFQKLKSSMRGGGSADAVTESVFESVAKEVDAALPEF